MMISNTEQLLLLLRCAGCGVWLNVLWEINTAIRRTQKRSIAVIYLWDCLLTVFSGFILFLFSLAVNGGELRAIMLIAMGVGVAVSHASIGVCIQRLFVYARRLFLPIHRCFSHFKQQVAFFCKKTQKKFVFFCKKVLQLQHS